MTRRGRRALPAIAAIAVACTPGTALAIHTEEIAELAPDRPPPCETVECADPFAAKRCGCHFTPPQDTPGRLVVWASGVDLNPFNRNMGGIYIARDNGLDQRRLTAFTNAGRELDDHGLDLPDDHPSFTPDSRRIVFTSNRGDQRDFDLWVMNVDGSGQRRLVALPGLDTEPVVSPDGERIAWVSEHFGNLDIVVAPFDEMTPITRVTSSPAEEIEPAWSPDGQRIVFSRIVGPGEKDLFVAAADGSGAETRVTNTPGEDHDATFSPDGTQIVMTSERPPTSPPFGNVYRLDAATGQPVTEGDRVGPADGNLTTDFGNASGDPFWSRDGEKIAFFKSVFPFLGPTELFVMNADGTGKTHIPGEGAVNVHPAMGPAVDADLDGVQDFLESGPVGRAGVSPRRLRAGRTARVRFAWAHPRRRRDLATIYLRIQQRGRLVAALRFLVGPRALSALDPETRYWSVARRLRGPPLRAGDLRVGMRRSRFVNVSRKRLALDLVVRPGRGACSRRPYRVVVRANDRHGRSRQERLGRLTIRCPAR